MKGYQLDTLSWNDKLSQLYITIIIINKSHLFCKVYPTFQTQFKKLWSLRANHVVFGGNMVPTGSKLVGKKVL